MENDSIDKKIAQLKVSIIERYNESIKDIDKDISDAKQAAIEKVIQNRAALIKELDDRLALIKQFPSVLEADIVNLQSVDCDSEFSLEYSGSFRMRPFETRLRKGKWKILILAKKVD